MLPISDTVISSLSAKRGTLVRFVSTNCSGGVKVGSDSEQVLKERGGGREWLFVRLITEIT